MHDKGLVFLKYISCGACNGRQCVVCRWTGRVWVWIRYVAIGLILAGCTVHIQGDAQGIEYAFDLTVDNVFIEIPSINMPPEPYEYEIFFDQSEQLEFY